MPSSIYAIGGNGPSGVTGLAGGPAIIAALGICGSLRESRGGKDDAVNEEPNSESPGAFIRGVKHGRDLRSRDTVRLSRHQRLRAAVQQHNALGNGLNLQPIQQDKALLPTLPLRNKSASQSLFTGF